MKQLLVLALLVGTMFALRGLAALAGGGEAAGALTFASVGFVVLAAYALAEIVSGFGIPRVTGYILAGLAAGPQLAGLLDKGVVEDLSVFNTLALALIALEAGLELQIASLKRVARTLASILLFKIPLSWLVIGGAFLAASPLLPSADSLSLSALIGVALMLGALGHGTSPAVSLAVISEAGAKGKVAEVVLALAVFKDVVMIVMLAISIAVARVLTTEGASMEISVFTALAFKIGASLGAGAVLGGLLIAYMRWVRWELVLVLLLLAYGVNTLCDILHLKMLLVFIAAGFTVTNFSKFGHDLHKPLAMLALPVFVVFFTTVGAKLDLSAVGTVAPVAGILFTARALVMWGSARGGAWLAKDPPQFGKTVWLGFISQAGVALGLLLMAKDAFPEPEHAAMVGTLEQVATMVIALNLLIGPILLRKALGYQEPSAEASDALAAGDPDGGALVLPGSLPGVLTSAGALDSLEGPEDEALISLLDRVRAELESLATAVDADLITRWEESARQRHTLIAGSERGLVAAAAFVPYPLGEQLGDVQRRIKALREWLRTLPEARRAPLRDYHLDLPEGADPRTRLRVWWLSRHPDGERDVPVRHLARTTVEGLLVVGLADLIDEVAASEAACLDTLAILGTRELAGGPRSSEDEAAVGEASTRLRRQLSNLVDSTLALLGHRLRLAGTPRLPERDLRYSEVAAVVDKALKRLDREAEQW